MNAFIKSVKGVKSGKEALIKNAITTQLSESVKEIQLCGMEENLSGDSVEVGEAGNTLCSIVESIFLHGLKDSLVHRARRAIADVDERPAPSFWAPLLIISHKQIIDQISNLSQISTEIGMCRAWIRVALNDSLLSSYFETIRQDSAALKPYYKPFSYVRDSELLDVAQKLLEGVETCTVFSLPCNSSLLNSWPQSSLLLAGIWSPTLRSCPVTSGVDVAQSLQATSSLNSETCSLGSVMSLNSHSSGIGPMLAMNEDEALKIILAKHAIDSVSSPFCSAQIEENKLSSSEQLDIVVKIEESETVNYQETSLGNSLNRRSGWSFDKSHQCSEHLEQTPCKKNGNAEAAKSMDHSYNALIESYNMLSGTYIKTPDIREVWQRLESTNMQIENNVPYSAGPEILTNVHVTKSESSSLAVQLGRIARERGLDTQNYECSGCKHPLGLTTKARVCGFIGNYFCDSCMSPEAILVPARIIHNWDFKKYEVSQKAYNYIGEIKDHPTLDLKILNPYIYVAVEEMEKLQSIRIQLNFLRAYLYTCREPVIEQLQKQMWPREYMYEHIHQYSVSDLSQIPDGILASTLQKVVSFGKEHVLGCWLCSQKGFVCEICNKSKILYPFDIENVYRCDICNAVYHNGCLNSTKPCPKCERRRKREDLPLLGATME